MTILTKQPGESDQDFRRRAFEFKRAQLKPSSAPMWGQGSCARPATRDELRADSPSGLVPVKVSLRWHVRAVLAVVMTVSVGVWFLS